MIHFHTIRKVKFLSKNSILTKPQHFHPIFLDNFLVKSKLSTAKKSKITTFSRVFHPKNRQFSREIKVEFLDKKWRFRTVCDGWKPSLIAQLKRDVLWDHWFFYFTGHKIENQLLSFNSKNGSISKKKGREAFFWQLHAIFWTTIVEAPIIFVIKIFFFSCGCLLLLLLVIWFDTLFTMRFWWTYPKGSAKNATRHGNLFVIQNVNEKWYIRGGEGQQTFNTQSHCSKITQNVAFESGNTVWPQASDFQKLAKMDHFWHF